MLDFSTPEYIRGARCERYMWLTEHKPETRRVPAEILLSDEESGITLKAMDLFAPYEIVEYYSDAGTMIHNTGALLCENVKVIRGAMFGNKRDYECSVDILINHGNKCVDIVETGTKCEMLPKYLDAAAYNTWVLRQHGYTVRKAAVVHPNSGCISKKQGKADIRRMFAQENVTKEVNAMQAEVGRIAPRLRAVLEQEEEPTTPYRAECGNCCCRRHCSGSWWDGERASELTGPFCLGCGRILKYIDGAYKCLHEDCSRQGKPQNGYYTNGLYD